MESRTISEEYAKIGQEWIDKDPLFIDIANSQATIVYLSSDYEKKKPQQNKLVEGECEKVQDKHKWAIPCDFTITLYEPNLVSDWDIELLQEEVGELDFDGFDLDWGFKELEDSAVIEDEAPEPDMENPPISKLGDVWQLGRHRLMCGDSTDPNMVAKLMNGQLADLLVTDPPYNVDVNSNNGKPLSKEEAKILHRRTDGKIIENDSWKNEEEFIEFLVKVFKIALNEMKAGAVLYIWYADSQAMNFRLAAKDAGIQIRQNLIWVKQRITFCRQDYQWQHEPCFYGWKEGAGHNWYADRKQSTILEFDRPTKSDLHPTMEPVNLISYQVRNSSKEDDIVLDLFGGSGSTLMACEQLNRTCHMMEYDPRYADVIVKRWENFTHKKAVLLNGEEGKTNK